MKFLPYLIFCLAIAGCQSQNENTEEIKRVQAEELKSDKLSIKKSDKEDLSIFEKEKKQIDKVLLKFFEIIVLEQIKPEFSLNDKNFFQIDMNKYLGQLDSMDLFDSSFHISEKKRLQPCIDNLDSLKVKIEDVQEKIWAPRTCFSDYLYWLNAQEQPDSYSFSINHLDSNQALVMMRFLSVYEEQTEVWDNVKLKLILNKKGDNFRIANAEMINLNI